MHRDWKQSDTLYVLVSALAVPYSTSTIQFQEEIYNVMVASRSLSTLWLTVENSNVPTAWFLCGEFLLHIPCWLDFYVGSFSYTSRAGFIFIWRVSLTHPVLASFLSGEFLLHIPCWLHFYVGSFSYTSRANFVFIWRVSLIHPVLASFYAMSFSYRSRADFFSHFIRTESLIKDRQPGERRPQQSP